MAKNKKEFREELTKQFLFLLEKKELGWIKEWSSMSEMPINGASGKAYSGINRLKLILTMIENDFADPRFLTFNQVGKMKQKDNNHNCLVAKGAKGVQVEYWFLMDQKKAYGQNGKYVTFQEAQKMIDKGIRVPDDFKLRSKYYTVFNAAQIEGLPAYNYDRKIHKEVQRDSLVDKISYSMKVDITYDDRDRCFYRPDEDKIYLPKPEFFISQYAFASTALHELSHSSGASHRLGRNLANYFGTPEYAFEELVAEISSCLISADIRNPDENDQEYWNYHLKNHAGYVQSWIEILKEDPDSLPKALKLGEQAADYLEMHGGLIPESEYQKKYSPDSRRTLTITDDNTLKMPIQQAKEDMAISYL